METIDAPVIVTQPPDLPYTRIRCIEVEVAPGSDRITAIGRADLQIFSDGSILPLPPQQLKIDPLQPQGQGAVASCTPLTVAQAIWSREVPEIVCTYGARCWELISPTIAGRIARLDTAKLAALVWPGLAEHTLDHVCRTVADAASVMPGMAKLTSLQLRLVQVQMLVSQLYARGKRLLEMHPVTHPPDRSWIDSCLSNQAGDAILQAAVDLSLLSMPPAIDPRAEWVRPEAWARLADEELDYVLGDPGTTPQARGAAIAEYRRREDASKAASIGLTLTRRLPPHASDPA